MDKPWKVRFFSVESTFKSVESTFKSVDNRPQRMPDRQRCPEATKLAALSTKPDQYQHAKNLCTPLQSVHLAIL